ncbi:MAG: LLM class flavin-dependent oxidoreductase [Rubellimicrobium sp.]|nr:LLM class flavin-dependent oxidoreductase [Rubellimicrobium sp.]
MPLEFALDTFGDVTRRPDGSLTPQDQVIREVIDEAVLADQVGVDYFGLGEHHRDDFAISSPEVVLAAIAARTRAIRLGTAVTVLSTDDPVRVFERFSTLQAVSGGRAEITVGRGSFTESFPLFGYDLGDYDRLFEERLDLLLRLVREGNVSWEGQTRAALNGVTLYPPLGDAGLKVWVGVGGSPQSVVRAVRHDIPMMLAIIGGDPRRFLPFAELYRQAQDKAGRPARPLGVHSPGHVAATDEQAMDEAWEGYRSLRERIGRERGWGPAGRDEFVAEVEHGAMHVGSPETVARKIAATVGALGAERFEMKYSQGTLPHAAMMRSIELYGTRVIPMVREMLGERRVVH